MMQYDGDLKLPARFLVPPPAISGVSGELLAQQGITTFACSETQKFGHVRLLRMPHLTLEYILVALAHRAGEPATYKGPAILIQIPFSVSP